MWLPGEALCPPLLVESLNRYAEAGVPTGGFLRAVLSNDLTEAVARADEINLPALPSIVAYCVNNLPAEAWGSKKVVDEWIEKHRAGRREFAKTEATS